MGLLDSIVGCRVSSFLGIFQCRASDLYFIPVYMYIWVVVKIMVPFWIPIIIWHLMFGVQNWIIMLTTTHMDVPRSIQMSTKVNIHGYVCTCVVRLRQGACHNFGKFSCYPYYSFLPGTTLRSLLISLTYP